MRSLKLKKENGHKAIKAAKQTILHLSAVPSHLPSEVPGLDASPASRDCRAAPHTAAQTHLYMALYTDYQCLPSNFKGYQNLLGLFCKRCQLHYRMAFTELCHQKKMQHHQTNTGLVRVSPADSSHWHLYDFPNLIQRLMMSPWEWFVSIRIKES